MKRLFFSVALVGALLSGTPATARAQIKVITTTQLSGIHGIVAFQNFVGNDATADTLHIVQQTQITNIQPADVDPKLLIVPDSASGGSPESFDRL